jgi:hypothetical protein
MAFLLSFASMILAGVLWMGLFMWFGSTHSDALNAVAAWLSPDGVVGWVFYLALSAGLFFALAKWNGGLR